MKKREKKDIDNKKCVLDLIARYVLILLLSFNSFFVFYYIFKPLTFYPVLFVLNAIYNAAGNFESSLIYVNGYSIELIGACIAGSAYFLLAALNLATRGIKLKDRIKIFAVSSLSLLALNIFRIILLAVLLVNNSAFFGITHFIFWNFLSVVFVAIIWIFTAKIYNIEKAPLISDINYLRKLIKG